MTSIDNPTKEYIPMPLEPLGDEWKQVNLPVIAKGYTVSLYGEVRSPLGKTLKPNLQNGQLRVSVRSVDGKNSSARVDRLVLSAFVGPEPNKSPEHIDDDLFNCQLINLKWGSPTPTEKRAMKALRTRAKKTPEKKRAPKAAPQPRGVQMLRVYTFADVRVTVNVEGALQSIEPDPHRRPYTPLQTMALAEIMLQVAEVNALMGVKPIAK